MSDETVNATGIAGAQDAAPEAAASDGRLGVAVLGVAHIPHAMSYARCLSNSATARLVGVYDESSELGHRVADRFDVPYHASLEALISSADVHAVVVCSATNQHRTLVAAAAARGLHVLCEKPIATTIDDAEAMIAICAEHGVQLHTAFVTRFYPLVARLRAAVQDGSVGELLGMVGGNRGRPPLPPQYPEWITTPSASGGGALMDHSVHVTDIMRHVSGLEVSTVAAEVDSLLWESGVDDMALMSLTFDNG
ncbi:MAG: Gfo/Idh/MocA family oxidoreductase, partial [Ilumatobacteraceae bacterium]